MNRWDDYTDTIGELYHSGRKGMKWGKSIFQDDYDPIGREAQAKKTLAAQQNRLAYNKKQQIARDTLAAQQNRLAYNKKQQIARDTLAAQQQRLAYNKKQQIARDTLAAQQQRLADKKAAYANQAVENQNNYSKAKGEEMRKAAIEEQKRRGMELKEKAMRQQEERNRKLQEGAGTRYNNDKERSNYSPTKPMEIAKVPEKPKEVKETPKEQPKQETRAKKNYKGDPESFALDAMAKTDAIVYSGGKDYISRLAVIGLAGTEENPEFESLAEEMQNDVANEIDKFVADNDMSYDDPETLEMAQELYNALIDKYAEEIGLMISNMQFTQQQAATPNPATQPWLFGM